MRFAYTSEQEELRHVTRRFLADKCGIDDLRRVIDTPAGYDPRCVGRTGRTRTPRPRGARTVRRKRGVACRGRGRATRGRSCVAARAAAGHDDRGLRAAGRRARRDGRPLACPIAAGEIIATLAASDEPAVPAVAATRARRTGTDWALTGHLPFVLSGAVADLLVVIAEVDEQVGGDVGLFAVATDAPGVVRTPLATLDPTRRLAAVTLADTPATPVAIGRDAVLPVLDLAAVLLAAEQVGGAERCLQNATDYAKIRVQFDSPIGSFQAIKHLLADLLLEVESARAASDYAAWAAAYAPTELATAAPLTKAVCSDTYVQAAMVNFQVHGGIAFTWEHDAHLHLKRAMAGKQLFGSPEAHRERMAELVLRTRHA